MTKTETEMTSDSIASVRRLKYAGMTLAAMAGAAVMVVELGVARVLTPVFGGSISVWAIVLATTMLALAAGYAFGGYRADRIGGVRVAGRAAAIGALLCAAIPFMRVPLIEHTIDLDTLTGATVTALVLIAPALFFLSQVSPALIRGLSSDGVSHVGITAGGVYAVSTVGSLVGTLAAVWLFLYFPLQAGFIATALLVLLPLVLLWPLRGSIALLLCGLIFGVSLLLQNGLEDQMAEDSTGYELIAKRISAYGEIRVIERGGEYRYMIVNGFDQGGIELKTGKSAYMFDQGLVGLGRHFSRDPQQALIIGLGPGVMTDALHSAGMETLAVEIDPVVRDVAQEYFGYNGRVVVADGRRFLQRSNASWDVIFVDAFAGGSPPWQLYTKEAFELYDTHLEPGGVVVLNFVGSHLDPAQLPALEAVVTTARQVFTQVDVYPDPWEPVDYPTRNIFIVAARTSLNAEDSPGINSFTQAMLRAQPPVLEPGRILTDDAAPLDPMVRRTTHILRNRVREFLPVSVLLE
jgi:spermidine synthase